MAVSRNLPDAQQINPEEAAFQSAQAVLAVVRKRIDALTARDPAALDALLHNSYYYVDDKGQSFGKAQILADFFRSDRRTFSSEIHNLTVSMEADVATVRYEIEGTFDIGDQHYQGRFSISHTLIPVDGKWLFLAGNFGALHTTEMPRQPKS